LLQPGLSMRRSVQLTIWFLAAGSAVAATPGAAQEQTAAALPLSMSVSDSSELHNDARDLQRRFEVTRVRYLPWARGIASAGWICDERVGRMCWRHDDPEDDWTPPEEDERLIEAREALIDDLSGVLARLPGDRWVLGQLVWYLGEANRWQEAAQVSQGCAGADSSWCAALTGLALHKLERFVEAEAAFRQAETALRDLGSDPESELRSVFDDRGWAWLQERRKDGGAALAADSARAEDLFWHMADPAFLVEGNERRSEHYARRVVSRLRDRARNPYGLSWGWDLGQLVIRYGWAVAWERVRVRSSGLADRSIIGHHESKGRGYVVNGRVLEAPAQAEPSALDPIADKPRTTYRPPYTTVIRPTQAEVFAFDRGDSALIVGAFAEGLPPDSVWHEGGFALDLSDASIRAGRRVGERAWVVKTPASPQWMSLERLPESRGEGQRYRAALDVGRRADEGLVALSDLVILDDAGEPSDFDSMVARIRMGDLAQSDPFVLAWETYGLGFDNDVLSYTLSIARADGGFFERLGDLVGLGSEERPVLLEWTEPQPLDPGPVLRGVSVRLPELESGRYVLRLAVDLPRRTTVWRERTVEIHSSH